MLDFSPLCAPAPPQPLAAQQPPLSIPSVPGSAQSKPAYNLPRINSTRHTHKRIKTNEHSNMQIIVSICRAYAVIAQRGENMYQRAIKKQKKKIDSFLSIHFQYPSCLNYRVAISTRYGRMAQVFFFSIW